MTFDRYGHLFPSSLGERLRESLDQLYESTKKGGRQRRSRQFRAFDASSSRQRKADDRHAVQGQPVDQRGLEDLSLWVAPVRAPGCSEPFDTASP